MMKLKTLTVMLLAMSAYVSLSFAAENTESAADEQSSTEEGFLPLIPEVSEDGYIHIEWDSLMSASYGAGEPQNASSADLVQELIGKKVSIPGFVVALDVDGDKVFKFLFVPYMGACIHVPPPPPNQLIYAEMKEGLVMEEQWAPVELYGTLGSEFVETDIGAAGYTLAVDEVKAFVY